MNQKGGLLRAGTMAAGGGGRGGRELQGGSGQLGFPRLEMIREPTRTTKGIDGLIGRSRPGQLQGFGLRRSGPWPFNCEVGNPKKEFAA
jgi:hypothetical protein